MRKIRKVTTLGLGYIGLPTSALLAHNGVQVNGVDVNSNIIESVRKGTIPNVEPQLKEIVAQVVKEGNLKVMTVPEEADVYVIVVPTPFKENHEPDISFVRSATESIIPLLKKGDLYIIESTSPVGTTEKMAELIYARRPDLKNEIYIAYCPERVLPGNIVYELQQNDRVIGGINVASTQAACEFFRLFVRGQLHETNPRTAEMCKLTENSSRDVQIAFANELSIICEKAGIDVWELITLANKHPRVNILQPGCGVGGHCIAVDPYFIVSDYPLESQIIGKAREINNYKAFWCAERIKSARLEFSLKHGRQPQIALMGLSFKPNVEDLRESPAKYIAQKVMQAEQNGVLVSEPNIDRHSVYRLTDYRKAYEKADLIVFLVAHNEFKSLKPRKDKVILDFCGVLKS
ncbi:MAG: UDP-N-acetyl-D-mannosamine dehydrogenase [Marinifilaceae bacterium]